VGSRLIHSSDFESTSPRAMCGVPFFTEHPWLVLS
jgi:hypothetical protein